MKKIRLIFLFLGIFLLSSMAAGIESCASYTDQPTLTSNNTYYSNVLDLNKSDTNYYHFTVSTPGTITITLLSGGNKVKMNYSESICPPTDENNPGTLVSHTVSSSSSFDFNLGLYATNDAEYNLTVNFEPAPLAITKTVFPSQVEENNATTVTYTIVVENHSSAALTGINLTDSLPSPFTANDIISISTGSSGWVCNMVGSGSFSTTNLECNLTSLARETAASAIDIVMEVNTTSDIVNTAFVTATAEDKVSSSATIRAVTGTKEVDLEIQKFAEADIIPPDTNFTYVIFVINHSQSADAELVKVTDIFPDGNVSFVSYDRGSGWDCDIANTPTDSAGTFNCYFDRSMGHEITYFTITAHTKDVDYNATATNEATVSSLNPISYDHSTTDTATINISDVNLTGGGVIGNVYSKYGPVEVSDISLSLLPSPSPRSDAYIQTKVASNTDETLGVYMINAAEKVAKFIDVTSLDESNNKVIPLTVILKLGDKDCKLLNDPHLPYNPDNKVVAVFEETNHFIPATEYPEDIAAKFNLRNIAIKDARIIMQYIDINAKLDEANETCRVSSVDGNIPGLPQCLTNAAGSNTFDNNKYINTFGIEAFVRCAIQNGQPCESSHGGYGDDPYDSEYGCYECTLGSSGSCSKDNFAIRPNKFDVNITSTTILTAGKLESLFFRAPDDLNITPLPDYNETEDSSFRVDINISDPTKNCQNMSIDMTPSVIFKNGESDGNFTFDDIGNVTMYIYERDDFEFAHVDVNDTDDTQRFIKDFNVTFRIIPDHFDIDANLSDHNSDHNFTYLHDINQYDNINDNHSMGAKLNIFIQTMGADNNITRNYTDQCYAQDTNLTLVLNDMNITYPGSALPQALTQFLYYNSMEDNGSLNSGEGNSTLPDSIIITGTNTIVIPSLTIENNSTSFPNNASDGNGTTRIIYALNFDRKIDKVVNPFRMTLNDINITDEDNVTEGAINITNNNATLYYAKARASEYFYEDIREDNVSTPITVNIYCKEMSFVDCDDFRFDDTGLNKDKTDDRNWYLSMEHNATGGDGNITIRVGSTLIEPTGTAATDQAINDIDYDSGNAANIIIVTAGIKSDVNVSRGTNEDPPLTVPLELVQEGESAAPPYTNQWLIYNKDFPAPPTPFYKVRFIGDANWTGEGQTGYVMDINASYIKLQRLDW